MSLLTKMGFAMEYGSGEHPQWTGWSYSWFLRFLYLFLFFFLFVPWLLFVFLILIKMSLLKVIRWLGPGALLLVQILRALTESETAYSGLYGQWWLLEMLWITQMLTVSSWHREIAGIESDCDGDQDSLRLKERKNAEDPQNRDCLHRLDRIGSIPFSECRVAAQWRSENEMERKERRNWIQRADRWSRKRTYSECVWIAHFPIFCVDFNLLFNSQNYEILPFHAYFESESDEHPHTNSHFARQTIREWNILKKRSESNGSRLRPILLWIGG